jgi:hypothetical protein
MTSRDGEIRIVKPLELIRQKKTFYLGGEEPTGRFLAVHLAECAMVSGAHRVELLVLAEGWFAVCADADWITPNVQGRRDPSMESAFTGMIPLKGGRQNEIRFEVFVNAFSNSLSVKSTDHWITIRGEPPPPGMCNRVQSNEFAVLFRPEIDY